MTISKFTIILALYLVSLNGLIYADEFHYNNTLIGNRASGMGGAYTAISDDSTGLFYNPAGIVFADTEKLSASVNAFQSSTLTYKGVLNGGDWVRESSSLVPNFFGITQQLGDGHFGFSYAVTNSEVENQDSRFTTIPGIPLYSVNINNRDTTIKIGPSYAIAVNDQINIGMTLYYHDRERELINNQWIRLSDNTFEWSNLYFETSETGIEPILGILWSPSDSISLAMTLQKTFILSSRSTFQNTCSSNINNSAVQSAQCIPLSGSPLDPSFSSNKNERELPLNLRLGVAYFPSDRLLIDVDLSFFESVNKNGSNAEQTINIAAGLEYYYSSAWAFRGGIFTNNANTPELSSNRSNQLDHVDLIGLSVSITRFTKSSSVSAGFVYSFGEGEAQVIAGDNQIQDLEQTAQTIYLSTSYHF